ncbi:sugar ABC transporter permease [Spirochaetia bacterium]|nr:sugar ABC transporter permease [Spirochaetia bacterium]GHV52779.1 sugar ABC transporter permease [Spirochaetia bacterium]
MKKMISVLVLLSIAVTASWATGGRQSTAAGSGQEISIMATHWAPYPLPAEDSVIFKAIEKNQGIKFKFDWRQATDYNTQIATTLAGGKLPDLLNPGTYGTIPLKDEGAIIALDDLLQKYGQNILKAVGPDRMAHWREADGHIYTIAGIVDIPGSYSWMIRKDWLDKVNLKEPATWDEWVTVWRAFRDNDMNGDGDKSNEIPVALDKDGERSLAALLWAFGIRSSVDTQFCVYNNRYIPVYEHPRYPDFLKAVAGLYKEGILDREFSTRSQAELFTLMDSGLCGSTMTWAERASISTTTNRQGGSPQAFWRTIAPPKGPFGDQNIQARDWKQAGVSITTAAEKAGKAEAIVRFYDYWFSDKGIELYSYGVEGQTFDYVNGKPVLRPELLAESFVSYRTAGLQYAPFNGIWAEDAYMQCLTRGVPYNQLADQVKSFYDGLFTINNDYFFDVPDTLKTEAYNRYRADVITGGVCVLRDRCIAGQITVDEFTRQYQGLKTRGFQQIIDQGAAAYAVINK